MKPVKRFFAFACALLFPSLVHAQLTYQHDTTTKVFAYGHEQTLAFCGGFNNPQFTMGDLNHDGLQDLVVFEPWNSVRTFINKGTAGAPNYRYAPEYAVNFPAVYNYLILADYNCDGIPDLFQRGNSGFSVYKGYYNAYNQLCFTFYQDLFYNNDGYAGGWANAYCNPGDIPAIVDVDNDGDLDFISYEITGGYTNLYKNMRVELGLPCDSIHIELKDRCWGRVWQGFFRTHTLGRTCDESHLKPSGGEKKTHSGNTPCLFDWDMDGDYDYLDGSVSFNEMTFLKNGRIENGGPDSMISQDTLWQTGGKQISIPIWPTAYNIDIDQDGKKDLLIAPNSITGSENYKCIWYYKNYSTPHTPDWRFQSDSFLTDKTIDLGSASYPAFFDFDKDGKPDLFVGSDGYRQVDGTLRSKISYYRNTSTTGSPSFTLQTMDFMSIDTFAFKGAYPAFGDIDHDGKADLIIGHTDGTLSYFKNMAVNDTVPPIWQPMQVKLTDENGDTINTTSGYAAPFIYDVDHDGKKDLLVGDNFGYIEYYQDVSTVPGTIKLRLINRQLGNAKADTNRFYGIKAAPFIGKIDSTGVEYLLMGSNSGNIYQYTGFQGGDTAAHYSMVNAHYANIDTTYSLYNHPATLYGIYDNLRTTVAVGDIANDGNFYMLVGNNKGGLDIYKLKAYVPIVPIDHTGLNNVNENGKVLVYPNPSKDVLNISWSGVAQPEVQISFINMEGQTLYTTVVPTNSDHTTLSVSMLPSGMYACVVQSGVNKYFSKFTVIR